MIALIIFLIAIWVQALSSWCMGPNFIRALFVTFIVELIVAVLTFKDWPRCL